MACPRRKLWLFLALAVGLLRAEEKPATTPANPPPDTSIATARRDFESLKRTRGLLEPANPETPSLSAPSLHVTDEDLSAFNQAQKEQRSREKLTKAAKPRNWLVDAMQKKPGEPDEASKGLNADDEAETDLTAAANPREASRNKPEAAAKPPTVTDNPLSNYMSSWMTPKDLELLKAKPTDNNLLPSADRMADHSAEPAGLENLLHGDTTVSLDSKPLIPTGSAAARSNPYLADLGPGPTDVGSKNIFGQLAPNAPSYTPPPPVNAPTKNDFLPANPVQSPADALKPSTDSKYFPQLRRF